MAKYNMEELFRDIADIEIDTQGLTTSTAVRLNTLKSTIDRLKELYSQNKETFMAKYHSTLNQFNSSLNTSQRNFKQIYKMLEEDLNPEYTQEDYRVISEAEWKEKVEIEKIPVWEIKRHDAIKVNDVDKKVARSVIKEKLCDPEKIKFGKPELRIIILGNPGVGKSATGNLIIGKPDYFPESYHIKPQTERVCEGECQIKDGRKIRVLDTPGLNVIVRSKKEVQLEFAKCYMRFYPGVHAFVLVLNAAAPRFTEHLEETASEVKKIFGKKAMAHCILVFTHFDEMQNGYSVENLMETHNKKFQKLVQSEVSGRVMLIDNHARSKYEMEKYKNNLIAMIDQMQNQAFSNNIFGKIEIRREKVRKKEIDFQERFREKCCRDILSVKIHLKRQKLTREKVDSDSAYIKKIQCELSEEMKILDKIPSEYGYVIEKLIPQSSSQVGQESNPLGPMVLGTSNFDPMEGTATALTKYDSFGTSGDWTIDVDEILRKYVKKVMEEKTKKESLTKLVMKEITIARLDSRNVFRNIALLQKIFNSTVSRANIHVNSVTEKALLEHQFTDISMTEVENEELAKKVLDELVAHSDVGCLSTDEMNYDQDMTAMVHHKIQKKFEELEMITKTSPNGLCFPATANVYTSGGKRVSMSSLRIGDKVLTVNSCRVLDYEEVVFLSHADHKAVSDHMVITTDSRRTIKLSPLHLLHIGRVGCLKPACQVQIGDILLVYDSCTIIESKVTGIAQKAERGLFCPHTRSGSIVVDDILASCYTDHFEAGKAHIFMSIVDVLYNLLPSWIFRPIYGKSRLQNTPRLFDYVKQMYFSSFE